MVRIEIELDTWIEIVNCLYSLKTDEASHALHRLLNTSKHYDSDGDEGGTT